MARILKFKYRRRYPVRPQTLALLMALVFLVAMNLLQGGWFAVRVTGAAPPAPPQVWMESAYAERFVADRPSGESSSAPFAADDAPRADDLPRVHRGSAPEPVTMAAAEATASAAFGLCRSGGGFNCVVDGDTFWLRGEKIRIADIDAPETHPSRCAVEASKGAAATRRLQALLSAGPFALESADRDTDRYGRKLRVVTRGGESLGGVLVSEGLARWYEGGRQLWC